MRPTGKLHLGNYMGALHNWVRLQNDPQYDCYFFIADLHALTTDYADPSQIKQNTVDVALDYLAAGLDPAKSVIFIQSHVEQHYELPLLLGMITPLGWLERVPSYKEMQENLANKDLTNYGFLGYPVLMASDILLYQADFVPVGQDQTAHVELTREVARRFNSLYKSKILTEPQVLLTPSPKLPGTDGRKMSKSYGNTIGLTEPPAIVAHKIHNMSTNGQRPRRTDPGDPDLCPVGDLHRIFSTEAVIAETQHGCRTASIPCEICKIDAARSVGRLTEPIHERRQQLELRIDDTWDMLVAQAGKAAARAEQTMLQVRTAMNVARNLGSVRRQFGVPPQKRAELYDLSSHSDWWNLPSDQRSRQLREYWRNNLVPADIPLSLEANRSFPTLERELEEPLLTAARKRVLVTAAVQDPSGWHFNFSLPQKSYEVWILLCWQKENYKLSDFVIPQSVFARFFAALRQSKPQKEARIHINVTRRDGIWRLYFPGLTVRTQVGTANVIEPVDGVDITPLLHDYRLLR
jgi:tryptophanyl-tRNA synthetase